METEDLNDINRTEIAPPLRGKKIAGSMRGFADSIGLADKRSDWSAEIDEHMGALYAICLLKRADKSVPITSIMSFRTATPPGSVGIDNG